VKPIEQVAEFLSPNARIVNIGHRREMDLAVEVPRDELGPVASNEMWAEIYDRLAELILTHRTTLVFVNTRRLSERVTHALAERLGENIVLPHHGSLARALRLNAEARLKQRRIAGGGGYGIARTGHRHWVGGSGVPDRLAEIHRGCIATRWPIGTLGGCQTGRPLLCHHA
jgi:hypothetical protein